MALKKGLGRGLSALIPENDMDMLRRVARGEETTESLPNTRADDLPATKQKRNSGSSLDGSESLTPQNSASEPVLPPIASNIVETERKTPLLVDITSIRPNRFQPRRQFSESEMENLANSIREHGILQPVLLRETDEVGQYELVAGERRWRAAQRAGLSQIPALVRVLDDRQSLELAIIENVQRHDISAIDTALAYYKLAQEFHLSQEDIAKRVGKSRSAIANTLRLLDLPEEVRKAIEDGVVSEGHGRAILGASGDGARRAIFRRVVRDQLSVRDTERLSTKSRPENTDATGLTLITPDSGQKSSPEGTTTEMPHTQAELRDLERHIEKALGLRVSIRAKGNAGALLIHYLSPDDLERLRHLLSRT